MPHDWAAWPLTDLAAAERCIAAAQAAARAHTTALRPPPPVPTTCCGRGCNGCVWEGYMAALLYWREEAALLLS